MEFEINNQQILVVKQYGQDKPVKVEILNSMDEVDKEYTITPEDFVTMLNWYQYQKSSGNDNLNF